MMKTPSIVPFLAVFGLVSLAVAQDAAKNLAVQPVLHPGTEAKHESFNVISKQGQAPLVFLGDSITAGWSGKGKEVWARYWEPLKAANFGIGGDRTEHILWRLQNGNYDGLKPKLTVLMIGTNNTGHQGRVMAEHGGVTYTSSAEQTAEGVAAIVKLLREKQPQMKILLLAIFPRGATNDDKMRLQNEATNQLIAKLADGKSVFFLDINKEFLQPDGTLSKDIMPDLLHPNEAGYEIWAKAIEGKVKELMADSPPQASFVPLFNGSNLDGWVMARTDEAGSLDGKTEAFNGRLKVADGSLVYDPSVKGDRYIATAREFAGDVHLKFEFNPSADCNNDVFLRGTKFDIVPGKNETAKLAAGSWHTMEIVVLGDQIEHKIDGETIRSAKVKAETSPLMLRAEFGTLQIKNICFQP